MGALEFLDGFMEVDDRVQEGKDFGVESGDISHRPIVSIKDC